jgi:DivIVA domain-containing protein
VAEPRAVKTGDESAAAATGVQGRSDGVGESLARVPADIRNVSFPGAMRGYDREAVDVYVRRVNRVIAELEVTRSPQAAVRHAVERVSEQTKAVLEEARESAEQITATAREEAEGIIATAKAEAAELVVNAGDEARRVEAEAEQLMARTRAEAEQIVARANADAEARRRRTDEELAALQKEAETRMRELAADTDAVRQDRQGLLDDIERMATQLHDAASAAAARFSHDAASDEGWPTDGEQTAVLASDGAADTSVDEAPDRQKPASKGRKKD